MRNRKMDVGEFKKVSDLTPEVNAKFEQLETESLQLYEARSEAWKYAEQCIKFLKRTDPEGNKALHIRDVAQMVQNGTLDAHINDDALIASAKEYGLENVNIRARLKKKAVSKLAEMCTDEWEKFQSLGGDEMYRKNKKKNSSNPVVKFYEFRTAEKESRSIDLRKLQGQIDELSLEINEAVNMSAHSKGKDTIPPELMYDLYQERENLESKKTDLINGSPELFVSYHLAELEHAKEVFDSSGTIVETPYVKRKIDRIMESVRSGRHVFIYGDLGSGKTELAKHLIRTQLSQPAIDRYVAEHPRPNPEDFIDDMEAYKKALNEWQEIQKTTPTYPKPDAQKFITDKKSEYTQKVNEWSARVAAIAEPLMILGYKAIDASQIVGERGIKAPEVPIPEEVARAVSEAMRTFQKNHPDATQTEYSTYEEAFKMTMMDPHIQTYASLGPLLQAMKEGRPVIIDEMNAIPQQTLILLNDFVTRKFDQKNPEKNIVIPPIPEAEAFYMKEGFMVIGTGNWRPSEDGANVKTYQGRSVFDPAAQSRIDLIDYDYLPQEIDTTSRIDVDENLLPDEYEKEVEAKRKLCQENELFRMVLVRLLDKNLTINAPSDVLDKVFNLARAARMFQDVFSGKNVSTAFNAENDIPPQTVLKQNVLSIRHMVPIVESWRNESFTRSLDYYVFKYFVERSKADDREVRYIYSMLKNGFEFFDGNEWPQSAGGQELTNEIRTFNVENIPRATTTKDTLHSFGHAEIVRNVFGPIPKREQITEEVLAEPDEPEGVAEEEDSAEARRLSSTIRDLWRKLAGEELIPPLEKGGGEQSSEEPEE